jgi:phosphatidate cytidylyltransferase
MVANADTAPRQARASALKLRTLAALVMAPPALLAVWFGDGWFAALIVIVAAILGWEWGSLCGSGRFGPTGITVAVSVTASVLAFALGQPGAAAAALLVGVALAFGLSRSRGENASGLMAFGILWIAVPCLAFLWLRGEEQGRATVLWLLFVVWATDIGAYAAGRSLGGPKLAPRISPNKTWSGLLGGALSAAVVGLAIAVLLGTSGVALGLVSAALAVVAQAGDLAESAVKRRFGVKDASSLIPGHGGLFDRVDGLLAAAPAVALISLVGGGSVVAWR